MKVPISTTTATTTTTTTTTIHCPCFEPTSVLDLHRTPSPPVAPTTSSVDLDNFEGWDSFLSDLGLNDHSAPPSLLPDFPPSSLPSDHTISPLVPPSDVNLSDFPYHLIDSNFNNFGPLDSNHDGEGDFIDDLLRAAEAFESDDSQTVHVALARLNQRLRSSIWKPLHRAAFYFKEALQQLAGPAGLNRNPVRLTSYDVVQTIKAHNAFLGISPISLFSAFTANQAILEALGGSQFIHVIDFDIGFGGHWASLMRELAINSAVNSAVTLRITAVVPENFTLQSNLVRENLTQFARDLNMNFHLDYVLTHDFNILSFKSIKFIEEEKLAVHLSPEIFREFSVSKFLEDLRELRPHVTVVVDKEVGVDTGTTSFGLNFVATLEFYTAMMESLEAAGCGGFIETFVLRPRITAAVAAAAASAPPWRAAFAAAGVKAVGFSPFADFQAECLLRRAHVGGFHVEKRHWEMMLCWHDKPLLSTSAWSC